VVPGLSDRIGRRPVVVIFNLIGAGVPAAALYFDGSAYALAGLVFLAWSASGTMPLLMGTRGGKPMTMQVDLLASGTPACR
jgi:hypothetical protein